MVKNDIGGLKAMAKHQKMIGLQRLRWYCQMCEKQCRDENGFKCHITTEGHLRQMQLFAGNSSEILNEFSTSFKKGFLDILSRRHGTKRVEANKVYQEYIADKSHVHMNATIWTTLTDFCKYLGRESYAVVDETENGWHVQYIDRDPRAMARQALALSLQKKEMDDEERTKRRIQEQILAAAVTVDANDQVEDSGVLINDTVVEDADTHFQSVRMTSEKFGKLKRPRSVLLNTDVEEVDDSEHATKRVMSSAKAASGTSSIAKIMLEEQHKNALNVQKQQSVKLEETLDSNARQDDWLLPGIVVRVNNKRLCNGQYYKQRGVVKAVIHTYIGEIEMEDGAIVKIDQQELETVIPKVGKQVIIVKGKCRGETGTVLQINADAYNCVVQINSGPMSGQCLDKVEYEDICRMSGY